jgi:hypothetical protein
MSQALSPTADLFLKKDLVFMQNFALTASQEFIPFTEKYFILL